MKKSIKMQVQRQRLMISCQELSLSKSDKKDSTNNSSMYLKLFIAFFFINVFLICTGDKLSCQTTTIPSVSWLKDGLIMSGTQEPLIFRIRRGGELGTDVAERYAEQYTEENVKKLAALGVTVFHTNIYKGFGMDAERDEMEMIKNFSKVVHKYGLRMSTYLQWGTMMYETFFNEVPEAANWVQVDQYGHPILVYGNGQTFRYTPCFNNEGYRNYFKKILKYAVEEAKSDFIHFDNFFLCDEPESCHCPVCVAKFREYLKTKYDDKKLKSRLGFTNLNNVIPPLVDTWRAPWKWTVIEDPLMQEWVDFKYKSLGDALTEMAQYIKSLNPEVVVETNPNGISGTNSGLSGFGGLDYPQILKSTEAFWTEEGNDPKIDKNGVLINKIRSYKLARHFNNILLSYWQESAPTPVDNMLQLAEDLAFNQTIGYMGGFGAPEEVKKYLDFYRTNRKDFRQTTDVADVAVLRSYHSMLYNTLSTHQSTILYEQALIQAKVPFDIIFNQDLKNLSRYKALILANQESLPDEQIDLIRNFVKGGGALIATENTSLYNEWRRRRSDYGLADVLQVHRTSADLNWQEKRTMYGNSRVVYIPEIFPTPPVPNPGEYFTSRYWKLAQNWQQLISAVNWACKDDLSIMVNSPLTVVMNLVEQKATGNYYIHLVNYDTSNPVRNINISLKSPSGKKIKSITMKSPDKLTNIPLSFKEDNGRIVFSVPDLQIYTLISLE
jgi:hypothetical protein